MEDDVENEVGGSQESLHSFVVHSFYKHLLIIMIC